MLERGNVMPRTEARSSNCSPSCECSKTRRMPSGLIMCEIIERLNVRASRRSAKVCTATSRCCASSASTSPSTQSRAICYRMPCFWLVGTDVDGERRGIEPFLDVLPMQRAREQHQAAGVCGERGLPEFSPYASSGIDLTRLHREKTGDEGVSRPFRVHGAPHTASGHPWAEDARTSAPHTGGK